MRPLPTTPEGLPIIEADTQLAFKVTNHSDEAIYCDVVSFSYNFAITPVCYALSGQLAGTNRKIGSAKNATDRTRRHYEWIGDHVDDEIVFRPAHDSFVEGREFLKVIATRDQAADLGVLMQPELDAPEGWEPPDTSRHSERCSLDELLLQTMKASNTRLSISKKSVDDDWAEATLELVVRRKQ